MSRRPEKPGCKVYVGEINKYSFQQSENSTTEAHLEEAFRKYGKIQTTFVAKAPAGFGFVIFDDPKDAEDACKAMNGATINGNVIKTEMSHGRTNPNKKMKLAESGKLREGDRDLEYYREYNRHFVRSGDTSRDHSPPPRPARYSPGPPREYRGGDSDVHRLREENARLRMENDQLRAQLAHYSAYSSSSYSSSTRLPVISPSPHPSRQQPSFNRQAQSSRSAPKPRSPVPRRFRRSRSPVQNGRRRRSSSGSAERLRRRRSVSHGSLSPDSRKRRR